MVAYYIIDNFLDRTKQTPQKKMRSVRFDLQKQEEVQQSKLSHSRFSKMLRKTHQSFFL